MVTNRLDSSMMLVAPIPHFRQSDLALAGGKGANLGELARAGFDIPPGYIVTTRAYDLLLQENNLQPQLMELLGALDVDVPDSIARASQQIHNLLRDAPIPEQIKDEILNAYRQMEGEAVAVRSSATAEDLPGAAFAGQQETFLNILGEEALLEAVSLCWASLWSERAVLYRARQKVDQNTVKLAVVVQKMVPAEVAGVMFTANPVSGARDELVIDANPGLGEAVVSGMVTPDHFLLDKRKRRIKEQRLGKKEISIRSKAGGGTEHIPASQVTSEAAALPLAALRKLAQLGIDIERHYGFPQDIEWAWISDSTRTGHFFVLQARPMTALPEPLHISGPMRMIVPVLAEMWHTRPYPLDVTTFTGAIERAIGQFLATILGRSAPRAEDMFLEEDGVIEKFIPPPVHPSPSILVMPWLALWRTRQYDPVRWEEDPLIAELIAAARALEGRDLQTCTWQENLETLRAALALVPRAMELRERYFLQALVGLAGLTLLLALAGRRDRFEALTSGVRTKTTEINQALEDLAKQIRRDPALQALFEQTEVNKLSAALQASGHGQEFRKQFEAFLDRYGHRETSLTVSQPAWKDQPEIVLGILKVLADTELRASEHTEDWTRAREELLQGTILGTRLLRGAFLKSLARARSFFQLREDTHFYLTLPQPTARRVCLELGRRLVQVEALAAEEEVFHLRREELETLGQPWSPSEQMIARLREWVARRKARRARLANVPMIDPRLLAVTSRASAGEDILLQGTSGSPGLARGPARIVQDASEFGKLKAGDVLVAPVTNPAWTPLFQRAAAVVVDTGGAASHAAIVAREYGIPAVMGTANGTRKLKDGDWIEVDGSRGLVRKAEEQKGAPDVV